jgi:hypothetical protein
MTQELTPEESKLYLIELAREDMYRYARLLVRALDKARNGDLPQREAHKQIVECEMKLAATGEFYCRARQEYLEMVRKNIDLEAMVDVYAESVPDDKYALPPEE